MGFVDNKKKIKGILNYKILGNDSNLKKIFKKYKYAIIGFGQIKSSKLREKNRRKLPSIISKTVTFQKIRILEKGDKGGRTF